MSPAKRNTVKLFVGIDVAKNRHVACAINREGTVRLKAFAFENSAEGIALLDAALKPLAPPKGCLVGMEATGHYWMALARALEHLGYEILVFNPLASRRRADADLRRTHTDSVDAHRIARMLRSDPPKPTYRIQEPYLGLRRLGRLHSTLVDLEHTLKQRLLSYIDRSFPEFTGLFSSCFGVTARELLSHWPTPTHVHHADTAEMADLVRRASRGRIRPERVQQLKEAARVSIGDDRDPECIHLAVQTLLGLLADSEARRKTVDDEIRRRVADIDQPLTSVPGISPLLAGIILGEIGDGSGFPKAKSLVAFAGLDPATYASGQFEAQSTKLSKRGSPYLRHALYLAASTARMYDAQLGSLYWTLRRNGRTHRDATCVVAAKLTRILWRLLIDRRPFQARQPHC